MFIVSDISIQISFGFITVLIQSLSLPAFEVRYKGSEARGAVLESDGRRATAHVADPRGLTRRVTRRVEGRLLGQEIVEGL